MSAGRQYMERALALAQRGAGRVSPNPMVGCVIENRGRVVGEGWHRQVGQLHAEREALAVAGDDARGATAYVTLEPCCHHGRQPPCTDALLAAGIARVVVAMVDPDPRVSGKGIETLRASGVEVDVGMCEDEARRLNAAFVSSRVRGRPYVIAKAGITLDGRIAASDGQSQWITGPEARARGHALRHAADAILVGRGTVVADDPSLTTRLPDGEGVNALPVILDSALAVPSGARVFTSGKRALVFCCEQVDAAATVDADVVCVPRSDAGVSLLAVLQELHRRDVQSVLVEGGGGVHRSFLDAGLIDRLHLFVAPKVLAAGRGWISGSGYALVDAPRLRMVAVNMVGDDAELVLEA